MWYNASMEVKTLVKLREEFEHMAKSSMFSIKRNKHGEYMGTTFCLWAGYWECAKINGIILGEDADVLKMNNF